MSALPLPLEAPVPAMPGRRPRLTGLLRGPESDPAWIRPALLAVLLLSAVLFIFGLDRSGYANEYYSAAALAASKSWKAFFFGSVDAGNFITVDKPAGALWLIDLSVRLFGLSSWSILLPQAIAGIASVALLFSVVRRSFGAIAGVIAALMMALTPVAVLMFRFNNPDALLTLLLIAAAWALLRGIESGRLRWILLSALLVGVGFNTKYLQADLVLPAFFLTVLIAAPGSLRRRFMQLLGAAGVLIVSSGWWLVIVDLIPAASRPYIGGSTDNTVLNLVLGYDGLVRIFGRGGPGPGSGAGGGFGGTPGLLRLFNSQVGGQVSWLLPLALLGLGVCLWQMKGRPRTDRAVAGTVLWGGWLLVTAAVFSFSSGIFHSYYTVQLAPAVAALSSAGLVALWRWQVNSWVARLLLAAGVLGTAWWAVQLLGRTPNFISWLAPLILVLAVGVAAMLVLTSAGGIRSRALPIALAGAGLFVILAGPAAYSFATVGRAYSGGDPSAGPVAARTTGFGGNGNPGFQGGRFGPPPNGGAGFPQGGPPPFAADGPPSFAGGGPGPGGGAGPGGGGQVDKALISYLEAHMGSATWLVAVNGANQAASIELATGKPVMAMGGFIGSDPAPTLDQLKALVHSGQLRYIIVGGQGGPGGGSASSAASISSWVQQNGKAITVSGSTTTLYDLSGAS
ncbi:MAG TPA: glycosyltransferase family 39 protein [Candidatus Dormibacteraeota bacterium]|nr:glycosyltransferase family 39 protein [Candidatus Dormibacteraeota bacterium]